MLIENNIELNMSHVGLGGLTEYALMVLFGNAHSHHLTMGRENSPSEIVDANGVVLYPAYFMTHLKVPNASLLHSFKLWDEVSIGVDVERFGETLLVSRYALDRGGKLSTKCDEWDEATCPTMEGNNLFVADVARASSMQGQVLAPVSTSIAAMPKRTTAPRGITAAKKIRSSEYEIDAPEHCKFRSVNPVLIDVAEYRDAAPHHGMIFAKFPELMDLAETKFITTQYLPTLPRMALTGRHLLEREIFYYGNCFAGDQVEVRMYGALTQLQEDVSELSDGFMCVAEMEIVSEVYQSQSKKVLAIGRARKMWSVSMHEQELVSDVRRCISQVNKRNSHG